MRETRSAPATPGGGRLTPPHQGPRIRAETSATSAERRRTRPSTVSKSMQIVTRVH
jgi:hypothetical protein